MRKACLFMISARYHLLKECLTYVDSNYNKKYNYPILIFYHNHLSDTYGNEYYREDIRRINSKTDIRFHPIEAKIPDHLQEKDMFWNLPNAYAANFGRQRLGYLHANHFWNNFMNYSELDEFDYMMRIDDDSWFKKEIPFDFFEELDNRNGYFGTGFTWNHFSSGHMDTRYGLFKWIKNYVEKYNITVKDEQLRESLNGEIDNIKFHTLKWNCGNSNVYNRKMFETEEWKRYLNEFNSSGGGYRYRWVDCEILGLYAYIHLDNPLIDFDIRGKGLYEPQLPSTSVVYSGVN